MVLDGLWITQENLLQSDGVTHLTLREFKALASRT